MSQTFVADVVAGLGHAGWQAWVMSLQPPINRTLFPEPPDERILRPERPRLSRRLLNRLARRSTRDRMAYWWRPSIRASDPSVAHFHFGWAAAPCRLAVLGVPALVSFHGSDVTSWPHRAPENLALYEALFSELHHATASSRFIERRLRALGFAGETHVVPTGVHLDQFRYREPPANHEGARLLFIGRQVACKGLDVLLNALPRLAAEYPGVQLDVIGDGVERSANEALASRLGLRNRVTFHGAQPRVAVIAALHAADVLVVPSRRTALGEEEGSPVAPKEAMAVGVPVVATDVGGMPEVVPPDVGGELVPPESPEALAYRLRDMLASRDDWVRRARLGRRFVENNFDAERLLERTAAIYERVAADVPRRSPQARRVS
jgi:colanic acid/amylovoran biosynthesis glycosyltransferase